VLNVAMHMEVRFMCNSLLPCMQEHSCGRMVAERDLVLRGAGELFGQRQSGFDMGLGPKLLATDLVNDEEVVAGARAAAAELTRRCGFKALPPVLLDAIAAYKMSGLLEDKMHDIDMHT
jgi:RecG-like helicase